MAKREQAPSSPPGVCRRLFGPVVRPLRSLTSRQQQRQDPDSTTVLERDSVEAVATSRPAGGKVDIEHVPTLQPVPPAPAADIDGKVEDFINRTRNKFHGD